MTKFAVTWWPNMTALRLLFTPILRTPLSLTNNSARLIAKKKQEIKATDPEFKPMETAVHRASRAEDDYVLSTSPELAGSSKRMEVTKNRFASELGQVRAQLEAAG